MAILSDIQAKVAQGLFDFTKHAADQSLLRRITVAEIREAIASGEIIEDYPNDKYGPSCLVYGTTSAGRPTHVQCSYPSRPRIAIITVYEPDPLRWIDFRTRRNA
jgi:hypothetical protein